IARISPKMRQAIIEAVQGIIHRDTKRILRAMRDMGFISRTADERLFDRVVEHFHQRFQEDIRIDSLNLKDFRLDPQVAIESLVDLRRLDISLRELSEHFDIPREWILLERTLLLLLGLCTALAPEMNPMSVIKPYLERFVLGSQQDVSSFVVDTTKDLALAAIAMPGEVRRFLSRAQRGEIEVTFRNVNDAARLLYTLGHQLIYAAVGISSATMAVAFEGKGQIWRADLCWKAAIAAGLALLGSFWLARTRQKRRRRP
ncbi:MAG: hypothetical protein V2A73_10695, partial [Pseudomonadota bacterium]